MLSVRSVSAQGTIPTPVPASGFGRTTGVGVFAFSSLFGVLFVVAVIMIMIGVIRARRDPERYGPQQARPGRPKQSRAKGLARAVIESIPIVRFGENNANAAAQRDIEPAVTGLANRSQSATVNANNSSIDLNAIAVTSGTSTNMPATAEGGLSTTEPTIQTRPSSLECSICLDDFVQSEEIRVLPCSHRFHPVCIDPWLLNVSGTCPICRYDLRPATTHDSHTATDEPLPPPPPYEVSDNAPGRSRFRELRRAHAGHEEYIAALRQLYHELENHLASHASTRTEAAADQESRPTSRLRDTFHLHRGPPESQQTLQDDAIRALDSLPRIV